MSPVPLLASAAATHERLPRVAFARPLALDIVRAVLRDWEQPFVADGRMALGGTLGGL